MSRAPDRRDFLKATVAGVAGLSLTGMGFARAAAKESAPAFTLTKLTNQIFLVGGAGANVTVLAGPDQLLMIDGGLKERSPELLKFIAKETGLKKVNVLFNTNWHPWHTGSNERVGKDGGKIIAQVNTKLWLGTTFYVDWEDKTYKPLPKEAQPNDTFYTTGSMTFADHKLEYGFLPRARSDGDLYVNFPESKVLVAGDVLSTGSYPILDYRTGGWLGGMVDGTKTLLDLAEKDTRIIPGQGPVRSRVDLQAEHDMVSTVKDRMVTMLRKGMSVEDMLAAGVTKEFDEAWGDPAMFVRNAYQGLWGHVVELGIF